MKKIVLFIVITLVIICLIPFNKQIVIRVNAPYQNCYQQLMEVGNWLNWLWVTDGSDSTGYKLAKLPQEEKIITPKGDFTIEKKDSNALSVQEQQDNGKFDYNLTAISGNAGLATDIIINYKTNLAKLIFFDATSSILNKTKINNYKQFMETPKFYYGFDINTTAENAMNIVVEKRTVLKTDIYEATAEMKDELLKYTAANKLTTTGENLTQHNTKQADSVQVLVGLAVNERTATNGKFIYMSIPPTKAVVADYHGSYRDKQKVYTAIGNYIQDKFLHPKIAPLEVYKGNFPATENDKANFKLTYPIF